MVGGELALGMVPFGVLAPALRRRSGRGGPRRRSQPGRHGRRTGAVDRSRARRRRCDRPMRRGRSSHASVPAARAELVGRLLRQPAGLLVVDDANWLDTATVELLGAIVDPLADRGLADRDHPPSRHAAGHSRAVPLVLEPLTEDDVGPARRGVRRPSIQRRPARRHRPAGRWQPAVRGPTRPLDDRRQRGRSARVGRARGRGADRPAPGRTGDHGCVGPACSAGRWSSTYCST